MVRNGFPFPGANTSKMCHRNGQIRQPRAPVATRIPRPEELGVAGGRRRRAAGGRRPGVTVEDWPLASDTRNGPATARRSDSDVLQTTAQVTQQSESRFKLLPAPVSQSFRVPTSGPGGDLGHLRGRPCGDSADPSHQGRPGPPGLTRSRRGPPASSLWQDPASAGRGSRFELGGEVPMAGLSPCRRDASTRKLVPDDLSVVSETCVGRTEKR